MGAASSGAERRSLDLALLGSGHVLHSCCMGIVQVGRRGNMSVVLEAGVHAMHEEKGE